MEELDDIVTLLRRCLAGSLTESERGRLEDWCVRHPANKALLESLSDEENLFAGYTNYLAVYDDAVSNRLQQVEDTLMESIATSSNGRGYQKQRLFRWLPYAAAILVAMATVTWYFLREQSSGAPEIVSLQADVPPGGNRATLTLADGRTITLDEARSGIVIGGDEIIYNDGNPLVEVAGNEEITLLELTTPKGGTYQVTLPDGTRVWLNAASTLTYPSRFEGQERVVELNGEAYFDVSEQWLMLSGQSSRHKKPFKVISAGQVVEVLGTKFNVSAYANEPEMKTTLVEGSVRVAPATDRESSVIMKPGEQATIHGTTIAVQTVDAQEYTAWKDGYFYFNHTSFDEMVRQVARWYDVEVAYRGEVPQETFTGKMQRDLSLMKMLGLLNISDAKIQLAGQTLIVQ